MTGGVVTVVFTLKGVIRVNVQLAKFQNRILKQYTSLYFHELVHCYRKKVFTESSFINKLNDHISRLN